MKSRGSSTPIIGRWSPMSEQVKYDGMTLLRFPEPKRDYCYNVGRLKEILVSDLSDDILNDIAELHFTLKDKNADVIYEHSKLALEVLNVYKPICDYTRLDRIKNNLRGFKYKGIIVSRMSKSMKRRLKNIPILELGFQILPKHYFSFYSSRHLTKHRKFVNRRTMKYLVNCLYSFYLRIGAIKKAVSSKKPKFSYVGSIVYPRFILRTDNVRTIIEDFLEYTYPWFLGERVGWLYGV